MAPGGVEPPRADSKSAALPLSYGAQPSKGECARALSRSREAGPHAGPAGRKRLAAKEREGGGGDSNPRPPGPQPGALPTELPPPREAKVTYVTAKTAVTDAVTSLWPGSIGTPAPLCGDASWRLTGTASDPSVRLAIRPSVTPAFAASTRAFAVASSTAAPSARR